MNMQAAINTPFSTRFARLFPADRPAHLAFDRIASKLKAEPGWNQHARKYMLIDDGKTDIEYVTREKESESESEGGKFAPGDKSPELVLTERKAQDSVHGRHARLSHNYSSGALLLHVVDKSLASVDGKEVRDSIMIWSSETLITFGTLSYRIQLDGAADSVHRRRLNFYQQIHGLGAQNYPVTLVSTPATSNYVHKDYLIKNPVGHEGSSTVFAAMHLKTGAVVAIKRIVRHHRNANLIEREIQMANILGRHVSLLPPTSTL